MHSMNKRKPTSHDEAVILKEAKLAGSKGTPGEPASAPGPAAPREEPLSASVNMPGEKHASGSTSVHRVNGATTACRWRLSRPGAACHHRGEPREAGLGRRALASAETDALPPGSRQSRVQRQPGCGPFPARPAAGLGAGLLARRRGAGQAGTLSRANADPGAGSAAAAAGPSGAHRPRCQERLLPPVGQRFEGRPRGTPGKWASRPR